MSIMHKFWRKKRPQDPNQTPKETEVLSKEANETAVWNLYNKKAEQYDRDMIKDWNESLSNLLIFAALFSAILTAFVIESMKKLEDNTQDVSRDLLMFIANQNFNLTHGALASPFIRQPFVAETYVIAMNCVFFASLSFSLVAALASIIILQWISKYDAGLSSIQSAQARAIRRDFRLAGVQSWKMPDIIAALPNLLYISLALFFAGLITWLNHLNTIVGAAVSSVFALGLFFYFGTTALAVLFTSAPFHTPVSNSVVGVFFQDPFKREEIAIRGDVASKSRALMRLLDSTEISSHSVSHLITTIRSIVRLPIPQLFEKESILRHGSWRDIFDCLLSPYRGVDLALLNGKECECLENIAESAAILLVYEDHDKRGSYGEWLRSINGWENNLIIRTSSILLDFDWSLSRTIFSDASELPTPLLYTTFVKLQILIRLGNNDPRFLDLLSGALDMPFRQMTTKELIPESVFGIYLATTASAICSIYEPKAQEDRLDVSLQSFIKIISPMIQHIPTTNNPHIDSIRRILRGIFIRSCGKLARTKELLSTKEQLSEISQMLVPSLQETCQHVSLEALLLSASTVILENSDYDLEEAVYDVIRRAFEICYRTPEPTNAFLKHVMSIDRFLDGCSTQPVESIKLLNKTIYRHPEFHQSSSPSVLLTEVEIQHALSIRTPALRIMVTGASGRSLNLHAITIGPEDLGDPLFRDAALYWIRQQLQKSINYTLAAEEMTLLQDLATLPTVRREFFDRAEFFVVQRDQASLRKQLNLLHSIFQKKAFLQLLFAIEESRELGLTYQRETRSAMSEHLRTKMRHPITAQMFLSQIDNVWRADGVSSSILLYGFRGLYHCTDVVIVEQGCVIVAEILETVPVDCAEEYLEVAMHLVSQIRTLQPKTQYLRKLTEGFTRAMERQQALRSHYGDECEFKDWILDLGSRPHTAAAPETVWGGWIPGMEKVIAQLST